HPPPPTPLYPLSLHDALPISLGGLAIGESRGVMFETTAWAADLLPDGAPRYFMGIGDPEGVLEVIERGVDMFDCVLPTRTARTGDRKSTRLNSSHQIISYAVF